MSCPRYLKNNSAIILMTLALLLFSSTALQGNTVPPAPANHFYGDANGDLAITSADANQMKNYILGLP